MSNSLLVLGLKMPVSETYCVFNNRNLLPCNCDWLTQLWSDFGIMGELRCYSTVHRKGTAQGVSDRILCREVAEGSRWSLYSWNLTYTMEAWDSFPLYSLIFPWTLDVQFFISSGCQRGGQKLDYEPHCLYRCCPLWIALFCHCLVRFISPQAKTWFSRFARFEDNSDLPSTF